MYELNVTDKLVYQLNMHHSVGQQFWFKWSLSTVSNHQMHGHSNGKLRWDWQQEAA